MKKLVIFDLDGTLLNTLTDLTNSVNHTLKYFNQTPLSEKEIRYYLGFGPRHLLDKALKMEMSDYEYHDIYEIYNNYYRIHKNDYTRPYEGIVEVLVKLKESGYLLSVCSNKQDDATKSLVKDIFGDVFDFVIGSSDLYQKKPAPDMVYKTLEVLNVKKEDAIYIGDTEVDLKTASQSGLRSIAVLYGFRDKEDLRDFSPLAFVDEPRELVEVVKKHL